MFASLVFFLSVLKAGFLERGPAGGENPVNIQLRWNPDVPGETVTLFAVPEKFYTPVYNFLNPLE